MAVPYSFVLSQGGEILEIDDAHVDAAIQGIPCEHRETGPTMRRALIGQQLKQRA